jgi:hypothetical protein
MLVFDGISCEANILRGQLKHSWLENEVLFFSSENIVSIWKLGKWTELERKYRARIEDTFGLADKLADGFSPAQLVDTLRPLASLNPQDKGAIKIVIHAVYLESSNILSLQVPLKDATLNMDAALEELRRAWVLSGPQGEAAVKAAWRKVHIKAKALIEVLERLPKGIVLP